MHTKTTSREKREANLVTAIILEAACFCKFCGHVWWLEAMNKHLKADAQKKLNVCESRKDKLISLCFFFVKEKKIWEISKVNACIFVNKIIRGT